MNVGYYEQAVVRPSTSTMARAEKLVCGYLASIPLLWVVGLNLPVAFLVTFGTFLFGVRSRSAWLHAAPWFLVGTMQILSVLVNWSASNQPYWMIGKHFLASYVSGWFLLGAAIGIGASGLVRQTKLIEAISTLTIWTALLAIPTILAAYMLNKPYLVMLTPVGHLMPTFLPSRVTSFGMFFYNWDNLAGFHFPRIALFYPWPTALGFAGVCTLFVLWGSPNRRCRILGILCGSGMVCCSLSRTAFVTVAVCLAVRWVLTWPGRVQIATAFAGAAFLMSIWICGVSPAQAAAAFEQRVEQSRPGASESRNDVYEANWIGFYQSPLLGHGWPGAATEENGSVYGDAENPMVVGSHSTISGLLYLGGGITFAALLIAIACLGVELLRRCRLPLARDGFAVLVAILLTSTSEGLESLVFPTLFVFLWLGTVLITPQWVMDRHEHSC